jgi:transcriptional regulator with XRE-family HTH domain
MQLGDVLRKWRRQSDIGLREAARTIGVSHGTLARIEKGEKMDGDTLAKILVWLMSEGGE